jgi:hypothetical protein
MTPEVYTLQAQLVADIYRLVAGIASGQAGRVFVSLEDEIARQNEAAKASHDTAPEGPGQSG